MFTDSKLTDEPARILALQRYEVLDTAPEAAFDRITGLVKTVFSVPMAAVALIDVNRQWFKSCIGMNGPESQRDQSFCTETIQDRTPLYVPDASADFRFAESPFVTGPPFIRGYLGAPLSTPDGYNIGSLCAMDTKPRIFGPSQIEVLRSFAALVIDELELRRVAQVDSLTGTATRRGFILEAERAIALWFRSQYRSALIVLDLDRFKEINDTHGHLAGDLVLNEVGSLLSSQVRATDYVGRLGGEEFGILLQDTGVDEAKTTAERLRLALEALRIDFKVPLQVTASFGVAMLEPGITTFEEWLSEADRLLYMAKRRGRNRCCVSASKPMASA